MQRRVKDTAEDLFLRAIDSYGCEARWILLEHTASIDIVTTRARFAGEFFAFGCIAALCMAGSQRLECLHPQE